MQFHLLANEGYFFSHSDEKSVTVSQHQQDTQSPPSNQQICENILVTKDILQICDYKSLDDFDLYSQLAEWKIDIVIFGLQDYNELYHHRTLIKLNQLKIGYELMNISAACRSFNYLTAENRNPLAVIFFNHQNKLSTPLSNSMR